MDREFLGVWIPREIWLDERLNALDKVICAEICSLDREDTGCTAGNDYLAKFCQCSVSKVSVTVSKLIEYGYIEQVSFDGRRRVLKGRLLNFKRQTLENKKADIENLNAIKRDNNISIKKDDIYMSDFAECWKNYPNKKGKDSAYKSYCKARKDGVSHETILGAVKRYSVYCQGIESRYIKHGSTWFNQKCWEDEYEQKGACGVKIEKKDSILDECF